MAPIHVAFVRVPAIAGWKDGKGNGSERADYFFQNGNPDNVHHGTTSTDDQPDLWVSPTVTLRRSARRHFVHHSAF
jgi:hypothetical protein